MEKKVSEKFISLKHFFPLKKVFCYCTELLTKFFKSLYFNRKMHAVFFFYVEFTFTHWEPIYFLIHLLVIELCFQRK